LQDVSKGEMLSQIVPSWIGSSSLSNPSSRVMVCCALGLIESSHVRWCH
jgi:hypothetical protein